MSRNLALSSFLAGSNDAKVLVVEKPKNVESNVNQTVLIGKFGKKIAYKYVGASMSHKLNVTAPCKDDTDKFGKAFCLSTVHIRVNKCLSNYAILDNYQTAINAMGAYHNFIKI